ncbi:MAG: glycosyltransferase [Parabacteroides sp.]
MSNHRTIIFHPALAPYRVDFFNSLSDAFDAEVYFEFNNPLEQTFDQQALQERLQFTPHFLRPGFLGIKNLRLEVLSILWRKRPDTVFVSEYNLLGLLVCLFKLLFHWQMRIISTCDDNLWMAQQAGTAKRLTRYCMLQMLEGVILADKQAFLWYQQTLPYKARYVYFPIIQSDEVFRARLAQALPLATEIATHLNLVGKQVILYVGRLAEVKQVFLLIKAFQRITPRYPEARLLIVGDGPLRQTLEQQAAAERDTGKIHFAGKQEGMRLLAYYNVAQLFVLPSQYEPFGTVVNEALLAGCYTLCTKVAGATCLISPKQNGELFDPSSVEQLAYLLSNTLSKIPPLMHITLKDNRMNLCYEEQWQRLLQSLGIHHPV